MARLRLALEAAEVGTWRVDLATRLETRDAALNAILGLPGVESSQAIVDFVTRVHPDDRARVQAELERVLAEHAPYDIEHRIVRPDGIVRRVRDRGRVVRDALGRAVALTGAVVDVTDRAQIDDALRTSEDRLRALLLRTRRLQELTAGLAAVDDAAVIARLVVEKSTEALGAPDGVMMRLHDGTLRVACAQGDPSAFVERFRSWPLDASLPMAEPARTARTVAAHRRALLAAPLVVQTRVIGVLGVGFPAARSIEAEDAELLEAMAQQCAQALERARLRQAEREGLERLRALVEATRVFARAPDLPHLLRAIVEQVGRVLGPYCTLALVDRARRVFDKVVVHHAEPAARAGLESILREHPLRVGEGLAGRVVEHGERLVWTRTDRETARTVAQADHHAFLDLFPMGAVAAVPLRVEGEVIGALNVARGDAHPYTDEDLLLLEDLAERAGMAVTSAQRRADAEAQRERLHALFMQAPAIIVMTRGPEHHIELSNPRHRAATGGRDVIGERLRDVLPAPDGDRIARVFDQIYTSGSPQALDGFAAQVIHEDGRLEQRYFDWAGVALRDPGGEVHGVVAFCHDVTDKVLALRAADSARAALQVTEERLRLAVQSGNVGTFDWYLHERELRWDGRCKELFGLPEDRDATYELFMQLLHPDDRPRVHALIESTLASGDGAFDTEYRAVGMRDGVERWLRATGRVFFTPDHQATRFVGTVTDITEHKRIQRDLRAADERLRAALEAADIGTYVWDVGSDCVEHDAGVKAIFGMGPDEGDDLDAYTRRVHPADVGLWLEALERSKTQAKDLELKYRVVLPDGTLRWVLDKARAVRDESGRALYLTGAVVDLTPERRAREAAEEANRAKDEFLAMLGHELRNPLSPILTALQLMKLRAGDALAKERAIIERQVEHMVRLVDDLLDVSRITRGKIELKKQPVELSEVVAQAIEMASPVLEQRVHTLSTDVPAQGLLVDGDEHRLAQVVANLLTNAAKYTSPGGRVEVRAKRQGDEVSLRVKDTGIGMPPELLPRVFDLFVQGERALDRSEGGLGLGLTIVRSLTELHGGRVSAASEGLGKGSELTVVLPLADVASSAREHAQRPPAPTSRVPEGASSAGRRVLVVDDNGDAALSLAEALRLVGHEARVAFDGPTALGIAAEFRPQVALLDIGLPVMDGYELARRLRESGEPLRLVAITGYGQDADRARSAEAGFDRHLVKPVDLDRVLELIDELS